MCVGMGVFFTVNNPDVSYKQAGERISGFILIILFVLIITEMEMRSIGYSSAINGANALL